MFGSVVVPLKALVLNLLSLTATFGAMVWIFQDGHLSGVLDFTATGHDRRHHADPHVLHRLRPVDGLRGVPPLPHQGGARPRARQRAAVARGPRAHRPHRHRGGAADLGGVHRLRHLAGQLHQAVRHRPHAGRPDGRLRHPGHARPGVHAPGRRRELVGAPLDAPDPRPHRHQRVRRPRRRGAARPRTATRRARGLRRTGRGRDDARRPPASPAGARASGCATRSSRPPTSCWWRPRRRTRSPSAPWPTRSASRRRRSTATSPTRTSLLVAVCLPQLRQLRRGDARGP